MNQVEVAFICPSRSWGGLEMNVFKLSVWLREKDNPVLLYCYPDSPLQKNAALANLPYRLLPSKSKVGDIFLSAKLASSLKKEKINTSVFHLNKNFPLAILTKLLMPKNFKTIYMQHMHLGGIKKDLYHNFLYKKLDLWVTPLKMFSDEIILKTNIHPDKIHVIPFGIELNRFTGENLSKREAREKLDLPADKTLVGFVGRFDPQKNQHLLIEAVAKTGLDLEVVLVGDYSKNENFGYKEKIEQVIEECNMTSKVHVRPHLQDIETVYHAIDIFCLTTGSETFGMVTVEALASGLPVIASRAGGTVEIIEDGYNGLLYTSEDVNDLQDKLSLLVNDTALKKKLSAQGRLGALKKYSHLSQCQSLIDLF